MRPSEFPGEMTDVGGRPGVANSAAWSEWTVPQAVVQAVGARFEGLWSQRRFDYVHPVRLQQQVPPRQRKAYATPVAYTDWGPEGAEPVVCLGGVANSAMRFSFLAEALRAGHRVVCMDWLGRGRSGWLADESEYGIETYVEQLRQLVDRLGPSPVVLVGSSLGGSVAIEAAARWPERVARVVLNDAGPMIARTLRQRRAEALARFHVFRTPQELMRRAGAAQKHDGPMRDEVRFFLLWHQTRWSEENRGRVYCHDPRAMRAYQREAQHTMDQWTSWSRVQAPVLLLHGMESDALTARTIDRMRKMHPITLAHVPHTGHTPSLCNPDQVQCIVQWLEQPAAMPAEFTLT